MRLFTSSLLVNLYFFFHLLHFSASCMILISRLFRIKNSAMCLMGLSIAYIITAAPVITLLLELSLSLLPVCGALDLVVFHFRPDSADI